MTEATNIKELYLEYNLQANSAFPREYFQNKNLYLPDRFELDGKWRICMKCGNCKNQMEMEADHVKEEVKNFKKLPYPCTNNYTSTELEKLKDLIENVQTVSFSTGFCLNTSEYGSQIHLGLIKCCKCDFEYILSFIINYGFEERPRLPDEMFLNSLIGKTAQELSFLHKDYPDSGKLMFKILPPSF